MKKVANILYTISFILAIVSVVILAFSGIGFIACSQNTDFIQQIVDKQIIKINGNPATFEEAQLFVLIYGVVFIILGLYEIAVAVVVKLAKKQVESDKKGLHIATIVLGACGGGVLPLLAGVFALVAQSQQKSEQLDIKNRLES